MPHLGQKPSGTPGRPSRERPTGEPQVGQTRLFSGTSGSSMIACSASICGAGGTRVSPAPSRAERSRTEPDCTRLVIVLPLVAARREPSAVEPSRLDPRVIVDIGDPAASSGRLVGVGGRRRRGPGEPQTSQ